MRTKIAVANGTSNVDVGFSVMGCRILYEPKNKRIQRIKSIAIVFPQSLIFPRRLN